MRTLKLISLLMAFAVIHARAEKGKGDLSSANLVDVRVEVDNDHHDPKDGTTEVVTKKLRIGISGATSVTGQLAVVSTFYARDQKTDKTVVEKKDESKATLDSNHMATVASPAVTFTYTPSYTKKTGRGRYVKLVRVEATGRKYYGWSVQVLQGGKLLGEAASAATLKADP